jgi:phosphoribosylformylglycinamidine synthase subunit PurL
LMFGPLDEERNRWLLEGVVSGIGGYGNCIGVPTVGGEVRFAEPHTANPTVNVMCVGIAQADGLMTAASHIPQPGSLMVLYGATTGRDGIGGVSVLASATIEEGSEGSRPSVQIGDPFAEKLLIEASLELVDQDLLEGLQDLGGAGLTCAVSESATHAGLGARFDLDEVPLREQGMEAFEILTSESQERMLAIVHPSKLERVREVCTKWGLATAVVATLEAGGDLDVRMNGDVVAKVPALSLTEKAPVYERPMKPIPSDHDDPTFTPFDGDLREALLSLLAAPNVASKRWVFEQYDRMVQGQTVAGPGSDAAVVRVPGTMKGLALSVDGNGRYGTLDPYLGGAHAVAEATRNVAATGAKPLAITNCLNFGSPERPEVMWQFSEAVRGMRDACLALETPVTGGNVSLYNESGGSAIWPTPVVGALGSLADYRLRLPSGFPMPALAVYLLGESFAELGGSEFAETVLGKVEGAPPALDLQAERRLQDLLQEAAAADLLASAHDCSDGGVAVALAECAILGGHGFAVTLAGDLPPHVQLFGESASRVVVSVALEREGSLRGLAATRGVPFERLGETGGPRAVIDGMVDTRVSELAEVWEQAIPRLLGETA